METTSVMVRVYQPGDEQAQAAIYNQAAAALPGFKPALPVEILRRHKDPDFSPNQRLFAVVAGEVVGYCHYHPSGRISFPWCLPGHEQHANSLFSATLSAMNTAGIPRAFLAYRSDWKPVADFALAHGFTRVRDIVNFVLTFADMPTLTGPSSSVSPIQPDDLPILASIRPSPLRTTDPAELARHLLSNPYFPPQSVFVLRSRGDGRPLAFAVLIDDPSYAHPETIDSFAPCFRLGAFGSEGVPTKRVHGLFSFLAPPGPALMPQMLDLLGHAVRRLGDEGECLAAQVASDVPHLLAAYQQVFRKQGFFPVYERSLP